MSKIKIMNPVELVTPVDLEYADRFIDIKNKRIALLSNSKPNTNLLFERLEKKLLEEKQVQAVFHYRKHRAAIPVPDDVQADIKAKADIVINGVCD